MSARTDKRAREIAREEVASLCGMILRRLQDFDHGAVDQRDLSRVFGEALRDFGVTELEPGEKP